MVDSPLSDLLHDIRACRHCAAHLPHGVRPVVQAGTSARILIIGQAPGTRVHASGVPWDDPSGDRLRGWTGLDADAFHDPAKVAVMPMGFCYPGKGSSGDLPPRRECAPLWHDRLRAALPAIRLTLLVGHHAQLRYLTGKPKRTMTDAVRHFADAPNAFFPLPHPSWRVMTWMKNNPWFEAEVVPQLRRRIAAAL
jgi:uracil-DNA glycosylase